MKTESIYKIRNKEFEENFKKYIKINKTESNTRNFQAFGKFEIKAIERED